MVIWTPSVVLAQLLAQGRKPPDSETLVSSRLLEYELWIRIYARRLYESHGELARPLIGRLALLELAPPVLARALGPFPTPVWTLDTLHLASIEFLRQNGQSVRLESYDGRMVECARKLMVPLYRL